MLVAALVDVRDHEIALLRSDWMMRHAHIVDEDDPDVSGRWNSEKLLGNHELMEDEQRIVVAIEKRDVKTRLLFKQPRKHCDRIPLYELHAIHLAARKHLRRSFDIEIDRDETAGVLAHVSREELRGPTI